MGFVFVRPCAFAALGTRVASGHQDGELVFVDSASGNLLSAVRATYGTLLELAYAPDLNMMATCDDREIKFWRVGGFAKSAFAAQHL